MIDPEWDFMKLLDDVEGVERDRAVFECDVNDPEAEVKWFRNDKVCVSGFFWGPLYISFVKYQFLQDYYM